MPKKMLIDSTHAEETRVVVVEGNKVDEFDFESITKRQLAGNIYLAKVTRVEPSLQAAFVDYGGNRHGFLAFSEIHPDYYQIPVEDRQRLLEEEAELARQQAEADAREEEKPKSRGRGRGRSKAAEAKTDAAENVATSDPVEDDDAPLLVDTPEDNSAAPGDVKDVEDAEVVSETQGEAAPSEDGATESGSEAPSDEAEAEKPKSRSRSRSRSRRKPVQETDEAETDETSEVESAGSDETREEYVRPKPRMRRYNIQEVIKVRQILLVQVVKEERGNKGAALTTYLSLAGRYCVLMPNTARGGGISRKITNPADRKKLKSIASEIDVPKGAGLIVRTAGAKRTKTEIKRDYEYLLRQWEEIRDKTMSSIAPELIYEEGSLIKRSIRDLYNRDIDEIHVEGETGYREAKGYMKMLLPSHAKNVKLYQDPMPLYARYQVDSFLAGMFNPTVQLRSGGYIVIGITEALVAIDVNSGRATKEGSIEDTALKTNLEASEEIARQLRLRDLAGLIVIDFIDMEERRNNLSVEKRLKDSLKSDRARLQLGRISGFGLLEMSRQRLRPGMLEATTTQCAHCHGTGYVRSDESLALSLLREIEEEGVRNRSKEVLLRVPISVANYLLNQKREHIATIEARYGLSVRVESDMHLISPDHTIETFKTATRILSFPTPSLPAVTMDPIDDADVAEEVEATEDAPAPTEDGGPRKRNRRRRRKRGGRNNNGENANNAQQDADAATEQASDATPSEADAQPQPEEATTATETGEAEKPARKTSRTRSRRKPAVEEGAEPVADAATDAAAEAVAEEPSAEVDAAPAEKPKRKRAPRKKKAEVAAEAEAPTEAPAEAPTETAAAETEAVEEKPKRKRAPARKKPAPAAEETATPAPAPQPAMAEAVASPEPVLVEAAPATPAPAPEPKAEAEVEDPNKPKKRGWWSRAIGK